MKQILSWIFETEQQARSKSTQNKSKSRTCKIVEGHFYSNRTKGSKKQSKINKNTSQTVIKSFLVYLLNIKLQNTFIEKKKAYTPVTYLRVNDSKKKKKMFEQYG